MSASLRLLVALVANAVRYVANLKTGERGSITVDVSDAEGHKVTIIVPADSLPFVVEHPSAASQTLNLLERAVVRALEQAPGALRGKQIAARAGKPYTSHFREVLSELCNRQILLRTTQGYSLAKPGHMSLN